MTVPCWTTRYEAAGYDEWDHWACVQPTSEETEREGWLYDRAFDMCDLDEGHDGEHVCTPQDGIVLVFR